MKNILCVAKKVAVFLVITVIMATMFSVSFFATETVKINGQDFNVGDTVTYTATFNCDKACSGVTATATYDDASLELDAESVNIPNLGAMAIANTENAGTVSFIGIDVLNGFDFKGGKLLVSMTFKVKEGAKDNDVKLTVSEVTDIDTNVITADGYTVEEKVENGSYDGEVTTLSNGDDLIEQDKKNKPTAGATTQQDTQPKEVNKTTVVWIIVVALVVVAVAVTVVMKLKQNKSIDSKKTNKK